MPSIEILKCMGLLWCSLNDMEKWVIQKPLQIKELQLRNLTEITKNSESSRNNSIASFTNQQSINKYPSIILLHLYRGANRVTIEHLQEKIGFTKISSLLSWWSNLRAFKKRCTWQTTLSYLKNPSSSSSIGSVQEKIWNNTADKLAEYNKYNDLE